jgi:4-amino-4-deoxy-L-arabinose transferase-like glycosyltransferase
MTDDTRPVTVTRPAPAGDDRRQGRRGDRRPLLAALVLAAVVVALLAPFATADPPARLTGSNAPWTDEGFNLANARNRVLFGTFHTDDVDRSLTNGAYSALAAAEFAATGPSIVAGRWLSIVAVAAAVLLLGAGLARPLGTTSALLAAAALGGSQLVLQYGRLGFTEPLVLALLCGALVLAARGSLAAAHGPPAARRPLAGAVGAGLLLAAAVSVKAIAVVPAAVLLGVPLAAALARRDRPAVWRRPWAAARLPLAAAGAAAGAAALWVLLVALPNLDRLRTGLRIWPDVTYPGDPVELARRLAEYARLSDGALPRAAPVLVAALAGVALLAARWRALAPARRELLVTALAWAVLTWLAVAVADYAPNRYVVPALPGLAVLAGAGLGALAGRVGSRVPWAGAVLAAALALAVAVPGAAAFTAQATSGGRTLAADQRTLGALVGDDAVVYGSYGPTMLFGTRARLVTPWAPAGANVDDPVGRFGVTHVLTDGRDQAMTLVPPGLAPLAAVRWGPHELLLYKLP